MREIAALKGLSHIDWRGLAHAYGPATDVPDLLRVVATGDDAARGRAIDALFAALCHQGTVYEATVVAVPFIAALARDAPMLDEHRRMLTWLLVYIAAGRGHFGVDRPLISDFDSTPGDTVAAERELDVVEAARRAVAREFPALVAKLSGSDRRLRWALAFGASQVPDVGAAASGVLIALARETRDPRLLAALHLTTALAKGDSPAGAAEVAMSALHGGDAEEAARERDTGSPRWPHAVAELLYERGFEEDPVR